MLVEVEDNEEETNRIDHLTTLKNAEEASHRSKGGFLLGEVDHHKALKIIVVHGNQTMNLRIQGSDDKMISDTQIDAPLTGRSGTAPKMNKHGNTMTWTSEDLLLLVTMETLEQGHNSDVVLMDLNDGRLMMENLDR